MSLEVGGMTVVGLVVLVAGVALALPRFRAASGAGKLIVLGPVFEAVSIAIFSAEHFLAARDLAPIVPKWLGAPLFWTYFVGEALLAAAISFIAWRCVRTAASLLALFFLIIVAIVSLPNLPSHLHDRFSWILTVRELAFASGAIVLAGSLWPRGAALRAALMRAGRTLVGAIMIFYAIEHFLFPHNVPGVPLEKLTPAWVPAPVAIAWLTGAVLLAAGIGLFIPRAVRVSAAGAGALLLLLTVFFYLPIFLMEMHTPLAIEGINYVGDTLLFAATVLLAGYGADSPSA